MKRAETELRQIFATATSLEVRKKKNLPACFYFLSLHVGEEAAVAIDSLSQPTLRPELLWI